MDIQQSRSRRSIRFLLLFVLVFGVAFPLYCMRVNAEESYKLVPEPKDTRQGFGKKETGASWMSYIQDDRYLYEISIVPIPANQNAVMTDVKAGRRNSKKDADAIREAITLLQGVLGELEEVDETESGEDDVKANGAPEEPEQSNPKKDQLLEYIKSITTEE